MSRAKLRYAVLSRASLTLAVPARILAKPVRYYDKQVQAGRRPAKPWLRYLLAAPAKPFACAAWALADIARKESP